MTKKQWRIIGVVVVVVALASVYYLKINEPELSPSSTGTLDFTPEITPVASTTSGTTIPKDTVTKPVVAKPSFSVNASDSITSWDSVGAYANNPELIAKAGTEIKRFSDLIGTGTYSDTILFVSIANQYELLGNGKKQYEYLLRAIGAGGATTGLPWHNMGVLMERLGALKSAQVAYEKSTLVQPELKQWHYAYLEFLTTRMKDNTVAIEKGFAAAFANVGQDAGILSLQTEWKAR